MWRILRLVVTTAALVAAVQVLAQDDVARRYPNRAVKIIVSAPPGGGLDIAARVIADRLTKMWGQPFVVENRPGAGGNLGAETVAQAEPDGYTLLAAQPAPLTTNVVMYKKLSFDPAAFEPLAIMTRVTGAKLTHVPYRGTAQAVNDLVAGNVDMLFFQLDSVREQYRANKIKMLAVTTAARIASVPEVPTMEEAGVKDFRSDSWNALAAPPKTPAAIVAKLNDAINAVLKERDTAEHLRSMNMTPVGGTPDAAKTFIRQEAERWGEVIRAAKISLD
jgi:tripartite-type tricarboxylate transporter receptor subunit TctC